MRYKDMRFKGLSQGNKGHQGYTRHAAHISRRSLLITTTYQLRQQVTTIRVLGIPAFLHECHMTQD
jgi:hypothetical protein